MSIDLWITLPKSLIRFKVINLINMDDGLGLRSYILQTKNALQAIGGDAKHGKHAPTQIEDFLQPTRMKGRRAEAPGKQATMEVKNLRTEGGWIRKLQFKVTPVKFFAVNGAVVLFYQQSLFPTPGSK